MSTPSRPATPSPSLLLTLRQCSTQAAVETEQNYKQVLIYGVFVGAYMVALYLQASAYDTGEVVATLRSLLLPGGLAVLCSQYASSVPPHIHQGRG